MAWLERAETEDEAPRASCDTVPVAAAMVAGVRMYTGETARPMRTRLVTCATAPASTNGSGPPVSAIQDALVAEILGAPRPLDGSLQRRREQGG